jgi:hypothetical protein
MSSKPQLFTLVLGGLFGLGCEGGLVATGVIKAPTGVRALITSATPAELTLQLDRGRQGTLHHMKGVFCDLPEEIPFVIDEGGCNAADRLTITATLWAVPLADSPGPNCRGQYPSVPRPGTTRPIVASASESVPVDRGATDCRTGTLSAVLTLQLPVP